MRLQFVFKFSHSGTRQLFLRDNLFLFQFQVFHLAKQLCCLPRSFQKLLTTFFVFDTGLRDLVLQRLQAILVAGLDVRELTMLAF